MLDEKQKFARVRGFVDEDSPYAKRLQSLGFTPGALVEFIRKAPLGDPVQLRVRGARVALRKSEISALILEAQP
ncbi:MAG: FeoA family protein [Gammaproteobacteria bacterium]|nr:FeoA family protein [Gammaproteobacteria bacterium]MCY4199820.1 FeoA family protein [Gammaproteobacteria bacterium]MCY4278975.1 FeoA family protein [Gammaproteobacteria bacterium]MCY4322157.1 FeoA family protein [Gammaproteobacteria bacterium]